MDALADKVKETLNLSTAKVALPSSFEKYAVTHAATSNAATWKDALAAVSAPKDAVLTKTLVFKPKVAKTAVATLIMVVALDTTATNAGQVAKAAGEKEARFAAADVVKEALGVSVEQGIYSILHTAVLTQVSPLSISNDNASKVQVLLDNNLLASSDLLAFHPSDACKTVFITAPELRDYLTATGVKLTGVDFAAPSVGGYDSVLRLE